MGLYLLTFGLDFWQLHSGFKMYKPLIIIIMISKDLRIMLWLVAELIYKKPKFLLAFVEGQGWITSLTHTSQNKRNIVFRRTIFRWVFSFCKCTEFWWWCFTNSVEAWWSHDGFFLLSLIKRVWVLIQFNISPCSFRFL